MTGDQRREEEVRHIERARNGMREKKGKMKRDTGIERAKEGMTGHGRPSETEGKDEG